MAKKKKKVSKYNQTREDEFVDRVTRTANLFRYGAFGAGLVSFLSFFSFMNGGESIFDLPNTIFYGGLGLILIICSGFVLDRNKTVIYVLGAMVLASIGYIVFYTGGSAGGIGLIFVIGFLTYQVNNLMRDGAFKAA